MPDRKTHAKGVLAQAVALTAEPVMRRPFVQLIVWSTVFNFLFALFFLVCGFLGYGTHWGSSLLFLLYGLLGLSVYRSVRAHGTERTRFDYA